MEDIFHRGVSYPAFKKKKEGQNVFLIFAVSHVPLTQNSQSARAAYFGVMCSELLHYVPDKGIRPKEILEMVKMCDAPLSYFASQVPSIY